MKNIILTEIKLKSTDWANISDRYLNRDGVTITRGKSAGAAQAGPSQANVTLKNTGGLLSPRNPQSALHGQIGRNTPIRISVVRDPASLGMVVAGNGRAECNDSAALSFLGDLDVRVDLELTSGLWSAASFDLASKFDFVVGSLGWTFIIVAGKLRLAWWPSGTNPPPFSREATVALPATSARMTLRATLDVDNGAGGHTVTFYRGDSLAGPWTAIGAPVVTAATTSLFDTPAKLRIGSGAASSLWTHGHAEATFYGAQLRNGIGGAVVASPDFTAQPLDPTPLASSAFADAQGNAFSFNGSADAARIWYGKVWTRALHEIAELPPRWDPSHSDKYVPVVANGILRRLGQGKSPVATGLRDFILAHPGALAAYYPLWGAEGTTYSLNLAPLNQYLSTRFFGQAALNVAGTAIQNPVFTYGKDMGASWLGSGMELNATGNAYMRGDVVTGDRNCALDFVWQSPSLGVLTVQIQDYNVNLWNLILDDSTDDGTLQVTFDDPNVGPIGFATQGPFNELQDANLHHCRFQLTTVGGDTQFAVYIDGTLRSSGTMSGYTLNGVALFRLFYTRYSGQTVMNVAHLAMWANASAAQIPALADTVAAAFGHAGETAAARITRVCGDGAIPLQIIGDPAETTAMGPQFAETRLAQIRDAEATDFGILTEQRDALGLLYRSRASMYAQDPAVTIDYSAKVVAPPFEPVDDDESTRNDVTASRRDGGSFQLTLGQGAMSVLPPPAGIGQYADEVTVNVETDAQLPGAAAWWLNLGAVDAARFPSVTFNLASPEIGDALRDQILALEVGDRLPITNIDAADIPDDVDLIVQGYTETFDNTTWLITFNCAPGQPYQVGKFGTSRYDAHGSVLTAAIGATDLSFQVSKTGTSLWTRSAAAFPLDVNIGGERMTVTGVTSSTSPQTFAIGARSLNGVVKSHPINTPVRLWDTPRYAY